jgi:spermidine/putrescine transport system ATP-binding protein
MVQLGGKEARKPAQLSGGEKQRVAIARSLVLAPDVLLLDEPMSALDPLLRKQVRAELRDLQRRTGTTFLLVTHDQEEALSMSDRMAVMNQGRIEQAGTPRELYLKPRTRFVADFLGAMNWIGGAGLRPESLRLAVSDPPSGCAWREAVVEQMMFLGNCVHVQCRLTEDGSSVVAEVAPHQTFAAGERLKVCWQRSDELELPPA